MICSFLMTIRSYRRPSTLSFMSAPDSELELLSLPQEILNDFFQLLDVKSLLTCRQVCIAACSRLNDSVTMFYRSAATS